VTQRTSPSGRAGGGARSAPKRRPPADRRIAERRKAIVTARVRRRRRLLGWALVVVTLAAGVAYLVRTPLFGLTAVRVVGTDALDRSQVLAVSGVRLGEPYLGLDLDAIGRRLTALPRVAAVRVTRDYPSTLRIAVSERPPVASVSSGGVYWLVAADGTVLDSVVGSRPAGLPYVARVPLPYDVRPGSRLPPGNPLANALTALGGMRAPLRREVVGVKAGSIDGLEFTLEDGSRVLYGLAVDQPAKDTAVLLIRRQLANEKREVQRIDVRNPSAPTVLARTAQPGGGTDLEAAADAGNE
jgi:cell division protein FtsQ